MKCTTISLGNEQTERAGKTQLGEHEGKCENGTAKGPHLFSRLSFHGGSISMYIVKYVLSKLNIMLVEK